MNTSDRSLSEKIYQQIRDRIIDGELAPGTRLRERDLAESLDVSRVPVREALPQLEIDGFVQVLPRRGAVVTQLTMRDVQELFDVRESLEVLAARLASQRVAEVGCEALRLALERSRAATASDDEAEIAAANAAFHQAVLELSGNRMLQTLIRPTVARLQWLFRLTSFRSHSQFDEHEQLFEAISEGNEALAASIAYVHTARGRAPSIKALTGILPP